MSYRLKYTQTFEKQIEKIKKKDKALMEEAMKKVEKLQQMPYTGKPLEYRLHCIRKARLRLPFSSSFRKPVMERLERGL